MGIKVAISCQSYLLGESLKKLLEGDKEIEVIGIFHVDSNLLLCVKESLKHNPDIILADFEADFDIFFKLSEEFLHKKNLRLLLIGDNSSHFLAGKHLKELVSRGVVGIIPPSADSDLLKKAVKIVYSGELWLNRNDFTKLLSSMKYAEKRANLGRREKEIISHICQGYRNKEIAQKLGISEQTVKSHCNRIYRKLGVSDRLQLALYCLRIWPKADKLKL
jgi:DNA-binding NarL/FixJ family response regulator